VWRKCLAVLFRSVSLTALPPHTKLHNLHEIPAMYFRSRVLNTGNFSMHFLWRVSEAAETADRKQEPHSLSVRNA